MLLGKDSVLPNYISKINHLVTVFTALFYALFKTVIFVPTQKTFSSLIITIASMICRHTFATHILLLYLI